MRRWAVCQSCGLVYDGTWINNWCWRNIEGPSRCFQTRMREADQEQYRVLLAAFALGGVTAAEAVRFEAA